MANRILRDTTDSETVNSLTWQAEVLFYRLMMKADDFGSFHGNVKLIKSACFPLRSDVIREADISRWITECEKTGLLVIYESSGKQYLNILNFGQRLRKMKGKFPEPPPSIVSKPPPETKQKLETETKPETGNYLRLREKVFKQKVSDFFKENNQIFLEEWQQKNKSFPAEKVLDQMDFDYICHTFNNENHLQNSFKSTFEKLKKKQLNGTVTTKIDTAKSFGSL